MEFQPVPFKLHTKYLTHTWKEAILAVTEQLYEWVRPSVVHHTLPLCSHHHIFMTFSEVITIYRSVVHAKDQGQRSKVKITEVKTQFSRFLTVSPVWIQIWRWNGAKVWCGIGEVHYCFSGSSIKLQCHTGQKIVVFCPNWVLPDGNSSFDTQMATKWLKKLEVA